MNRYGFDSFDRSAIAYTCNCSCDSSENLRGLGTVTTAACDCNTAISSKWDNVATYDNIAALEYKISEVAANTQSVGEALKVLSDRIAAFKRECNRGSRLKRSDLRTLRVG